MWAVGVKTYGRRPKPFKAAKTGKTAKLKLTMALRPPFPAPMSNSTRIDLRNLFDRLLTPGLDAPFFLIGSSKARHLNQPAEAQQPAGSKIEKRLAIMGNLGSPLFGGGKGGDIFHICLSSIYVIYNIYPSPPIQYTHR